MRLLRRRVRAISSSKIGAMIREIVSACAQTLQAVEVAGEECLFLSTAPSF